MSPELSKELDRRCKEWNLNSKGEVLRWYDDIETVDKQLELIMNTHTKKTLEGIHYSLDKEK